MLEPTPVVIPPIVIPSATVIHIATSTQMLVVVSPTSVISPTVALILGHRAHRIELAHAH